MEKELILLKTNTHILEIFIMMIYKELESVSGAMEKSTQELGSEIKCTYLLHLLYIYIHIYAHI